MFAVLTSARKAVFRATAVIALGALAACQTTIGPGLGGGPRIDTSKPVPVALLVPKTDEGAASVAASLENAARMAAAAIEGATIDLRVYDTGGDATVAAAQAQKAVDDGAKIILGPLFGAAANAAALAVVDDGINVVSFSNNASIAGGNLFVLGATFENTANRIMGYAASQGSQAVTVVYPENDEGNVARAAVAQAAVQNGLPVAATGFAFSQTGAINAVVPARDAIRDSGSDAIVLTSNAAGALPLFLQLMPEGGIDPAETQFIGLTNWGQDPQIARLPGAQGAWFAIPDTNAVERFSSRYSAEFGTPPHALAGLAFDGVAMVGALASAGRGDALTVEALTQTAGFSGASGVFRLLPDGTNQRGLAVATIEDNQVVTLDPAPTSFGAAGL